MANSGEYRGGDYVFTNIGNYITDSVRVHEISHQILMKSTHWGIMTYCQTQFRRADRSVRRADNNIGIGNLLMQAAENVFESHAFLNQLLYAKYNDVAEYNMLLSSPYYKLYKQKYFKIFLNLDFPFHNVIELSQSIPNLALATDLIDVDPQFWKSKDGIMELIESNEKKYNPDTRLMYLSDAYMRLVKNYKPEHITNALIAKESGLYIKTTQYETPMSIFLKFSDLIRQVYDDIVAKDALDTIKKTLVVGELEDIINESPTLDIPLPNDKVETIKLDKIEPWINECQVLKIIPFDENVILEYCATEFYKRYVIACEWSALPIFYAKFKKTIVLYGEDYEYMQKRFPYIKNQRVFYYFEGSYKYFNEYLKDKVFERTQTFLYRINEHTFCIFVKGKANEIFFTAQNKGGIKCFIEDVQKGTYEYINMDNSKIDNIFYIEDIDWSVYDDVVKSVLYIKHTKGRCQISY